MITATELHDCGFNCAQAVFGSLTDAVGLDEKMALTIAGGFGGGMRAAEVCGAVSGAVMALGMAFPYNDASDTAAKDKIAALTREFHKRFKKEYGSITCRSLLGYDVETEEGAAAIKETGVGKRVCPAVIEGAAKIASDIISENK